MIESSLEFVSSFSNNPTCPYVCVEGCTAGGCGYPA